MFFGQVHSGVTCCCAAKKEDNQFGLVFLRQSLGEESLIVYYRQTRFFFHFSQQAAGRFFAFV